MKSLMDKPFLQFHEFKDWLRKKEEILYPKDHYYTAYGKYCNKWRYENNETLRKT